MKKVQVIVCFLNILICYMVFIPLANSQNFRDQIDVLHYNIHLQITDFEKEHIQGYTEIQCTPAKKSLSQLQFDLLSMKVDSVFFENTAVEDVMYNNKLLTIPLAHKIAKNDTITVKICYHGHPVFDSKWGGFYFSSGYAYNYGVGMAAQPPVYGRVWFPCIDRFTDRATYNFYITVQKQHQAVCCGELQEITKNANKTNTYHWKLTHTIPTYLASIAVGKYTAIKDTYKGLERDIPVSIYVHPAEKKPAKTAFENLHAMMQAYEKYFGPYVWQRIGYVATPFNSGAMEHATNIAYPDYCNTAGKQCEILLAHELSHHWFGDLVTCETEKDMWLNEGWARYCEAVFVEHAYGKEAFKEKNRKNHHKVLFITHLKDFGYRSLYGIPHRYTYGSTVYDKGADVLHTLRGYLGDSVFFSAAKSYLQTYAFQNINTVDYENFLEKETGTELDNFFDFWLYAPGFPHYSLDKYSVKRNGVNYEVDLKIKQRLVHAPDFLKANKLEIAFFDKAWNKNKETIVFSDAEIEKTFQLPFKPSLILIDPDEKVADATIDQLTTIRKTGEYPFTDSYFTMQVNRLSDSALVYCQIHAIEPTGTPPPKIRLAGKVYWNIQGITGKSWEADGQFLFNRFTMKNLKIQAKPVLLYRKNNTETWKPVKARIIGREHNGCFLCKNLALGQYTIGCTIE